MDQEPHKEHHAAPMTSCYNRNNLIRVMLEVKKQIITHPEESNM